MKNSVKSSQVTKRTQTGVQAILGKMLNQPMTKEVQKSIDITDQDVNKKWKEVLGHVFEKEEISSDLARRIDILLEKTD
jgi:predicted secreted protein